jgi:hypothetical protein
MPISKGHPLIPLALTSRVAGPFSQSSEIRETALLTWVLRASILVYKVKSFLLQE